MDKKNGKVKKRITEYVLDQHWKSLQNISKWYVFYPYLGKQGGTAYKSSINGGIEAFKKYIIIKNIFIII